MSNTIIKDLNPKPYKPLNPLGGSKGNLLALKRSQELAVPGSLGTRLRLKRKRLLPWAYGFRFWDLGFRGLGV